MLQPSSTSATVPDDRREPCAKNFDFLIGRWHVAHHRLKQRLQGCTEWDDFPGTCACWPLLNGQGNVDDNVLELPHGHYRAASLRAFDPGTRQWAIWWLDGRRPDRLDVPVRGGFTNGVGVFLADDMVEGRPIRVRFIWSDVTPGAARWQQAFSQDGGASWETNWIMDFIRQ
jgi:hypothetical protein